MPRTPKNTITVRRLPKIGDTIMIPVKVTRVGPNRFGTGDAITVRVPGVDTPVTANAEHLLTED